MRQVRPTEAPRRTVVSVREYPSVGGTWREMVLDCEHRMSQPTWEKVKPSDGGAVRCWSCWYEKERK